MLLKQHKRYYYNYFNKFHSKIYPRRHLVYIIFEINFTFTICQGVLEILNFQKITLLFFFYILALISTFQFQKSFVYIHLNFDINAVFEYVRTLRYI